MLDHSMNPTHYQWLKHPAMHHCEATALAAADACVGKSNP
ncbi:hypothetical protein O23A_p1266 [Aeromonas salmonicida]|nr:hypothetical protein O23A_p1266 [Aeromonas salmonicida]